MSDEIKTDAAYVRDTTKSGYNTSVIKSNSFTNGSLRRVPRVINLNRNDVSLREFEAHDAITKDVLLPKSSSFHNITQTKPYCANTSNELPKRASSTSINNTAGKQGFNNFWSENLAKSNQQKSAWNYGKIIAADDFDETLLSLNSGPDTIKVHRRRLNRKPNRFSLNLEEWEKLNLQPVVEHKYLESLPVVEQNISTSTCITPAQQLPSPTEKNNGNKELSKQISNSSSQINEQSQYNNENKPVQPDILLNSPPKNAVTNTSGASSKLESSLKINLSQLMTPLCENLSNIMISHTQEPQKTLSPKLVDESSPSASAPFNISAKSGNINNTTFNETKTPQNSEPLRPKASENSNNAREYFVNKTKQQPCKGLIDNPSPVESYASTQTTIREHPSASFPIRYSRITDKNTCFPTINGTKPSLSINNITKPLYFPQTKIEASQQNDLRQFQKTQDKTSKFMEFIKNTVGDVNKTNQQNVFTPQTTGMISHSPPVIGKNFNTNTKSDVNILASSDTEEQQQLPTSSIQTYSNVNDLATSINCKSNNNTLSRNSSFKKTTQNNNDDSTLSAGPSKSQTQQFQSSQSFVNADSNGNNSLKSCEPSTKTTSSTTHDTCHLKSLKDPIKPIEGTALPSSNKLQKNNNCKLKAGNSPTELADDEVVKSLFRF